MRKRTVVLVPVLAVLGALGASTIATATPGSGAAGPVLARGVFEHGLDAKFKVRTEHGAQVSAVKGPAQAVVQEITIAPGGHTGWHSHHGPAIVVVMQGALTLYDGDDPDCVGHAYEKGEAFIDPGQGHVHIGRNETDGVIKVSVTYLIPGTDPATSPRIDQPHPGNC